MFTSSFLGSTAKSSFNSIVRVNGVFFVKRTQNISAAFKSPKLFLCSINLIHTRSNVRSKIGGNRLFFGLNNQFPGNNRVWQFHLNKMSNIRVMTTTMNNEH